MKRGILTVALALTGFGCVGRSWRVAPECMGARDPSAAVRDSASADKVVHTDPPRVLDVEGFRRALRGAYPPDLRALGIGGTTLVHALISEEGCVAVELVNRSSGSPALDSVALRTVRAARFAPARNGDQKVALWIEMPVNFTAR